VTHALLENVIGCSQCNQKTGSRVPQSVKGEAGQFGLHNGRMPDAVAEVAGMERSAVGTDEDELVWSRSAVSQQMLGQHARDEARHGDDSATGR
jgi:protein-arginine kinase activator protein McsA